MPIATKTQPRPETPFLQPKWLWNYIPQGGIPSRTRCQGLATPQEREAGANLVAE
jgi:hypothetical protein